MPKRTRAGALLALAVTSPALGATLAAPVDAATGAPGSPPAYRRR